MHLVSFLIYFTLGCCCLATTYASVTQQSPLVAWRSSSSRTANKLQVATLGINKMYNTLVESKLWDPKHKCTPENQVEIVLLFHQDVHAQDLIDHPHDPTVGFIKKYFDQASVGLEVPHFSVSSSSNTVRDQVKYLAQSMVKDSKCTVVTMDLPELRRNDDIFSTKHVEQEAELLKLEQSIQSFKNALFIYVGIPDPARIQTRLPQLNIAQQQQEEVGPEPQQDLGAIVPLLSLPYIARYQIFSPALFMTLSVFILLMLILIVGVSWLASIKVPSGGISGVKRPKVKTG